MAVSERAELSGAPFGVALERGGDSGCISVWGPYGENLQAQFENELEAARDSHLRQLIIDLQALYQADAEALDALLGRWAGNHNGGLRLILVRVPRHLRAVVEETGLDATLPIAFESRAGRD